MSIYRTSKPNSSWLARGLIFALLSFILAACGGGGGGDGVERTGSGPAAGTATSDLTAFGISGFSINASVDEFTIAWTNPIDPQVAISNYSLEAIAYENEVGGLNISAPLTKVFLYNAVHNITFTDLTNGNYYEFFVTANYANSSIPSDRIRLFNGRLLAGEDSDGDGRADGQDPDDDNDGVVDATDNCPTIANPDQNNTIGDNTTLGDACDNEDNDMNLAGDPIYDLSDNCPTIANPDQAANIGVNTILGDACDNEDDDMNLAGDPIYDLTDNCPTIANPDQNNTIVTGDNIGDACGDGDEDDVVDAMDNCPTIANEDQNNTIGVNTILGDACDNEDNDMNLAGDPIYDLSDNCPTIANPDQAANIGVNTILGDACDNEDDDTYLEAGATYAAGDPIYDLSDNCPTIANPDQAANIGDNTILGDACDNEDNDATVDGDPIYDLTDNCPVLANPDQTNTDNDGMGDACDADDDNDGVSDTIDLHPLDGTRAGDPDGDNIDTTTDNCPFFPSPDQTDTENDGAGDVCDVDDDGDGLIEIRNATAFNAMRYNLRGTNLTLAAGGMGDATGCGQSIHDNDSVPDCNGYELMVDIDLAAAGYPTWEPIGTCGGDVFCRTASAQLFEANFHGNGNSISNLKIQDISTHGVGLFGAVAAGVEISSIHLTNVNISAAGYGNVGGLVGFGANARISSSSAQADSITGDVKVGGLIGLGFEARITYSSAQSNSITGNDNVGGLLGWGERARISSSSAQSGSIISDGNRVGGFVGNGKNVVITSSSAQADSITGNKSVGGLVGDGEGAGIAASSAQSNSITGNELVGGLAGSGSSAIIEYSYSVANSINTSGTAGGLLASAASVLNSYWNVDDFVNSQPPADDATTTGVRRTLTQMTSATAPGTSIYTAWNAPHCNPTTGEYIANIDAADGFIQAWDLGTNLQFPVLTCLPISVAEQQDRINRLFDEDGDGVTNHLDNCPQTVTSDRTDTDNDGMGDECDDDDDNDGVADTIDTHRLDNTIAGSHDGDTIDDSPFNANPDNCPLVANQDQAANIGDNTILGDACDNEDGDTYAEAGDTYAAGDPIYDLNDNCPTIANPDQTDVNNNDVGDACDTVGDGDADGVDNMVDNCDMIYNPSQSDLDNDDEGDVCDADSDSDNDGVVDAQDLDADNDGFIEIRFADELNAARYNLQGTSLTLAAGGIGNASGCGQSYSGDLNTIVDCSGYELMADIDLAAAGYTNWEPIGNCGSDATCFVEEQFFKANFQGNGNSISNLKIEVINTEDLSTHGVGLFGAVAPGVEISNIHLTNVNISAAGSSSVGGLVGAALTAIITNSSAQADSITGNADIGGLIGSGFNAIITNSSAQSDSITGSSADAGSSNNIGGLIGLGISAIITSSSAQADSITGNQNVGGLVGWGEGATIISSSAQSHSITGVGPSSARIGGLVGQGVGAIIQASTAQSVSMTGNEDLGGLVGNGQEAIINSSSAQAHSITGVGISAGSMGGLVGNGVDTIITYSFSVTNSINGSSNTEGLVGIISGSSVSTSYWNVSDFVESQPLAADGATTGERKTRSELTTPTDSNGFAGTIYANWANAYCNPTTGAYRESATPLAAPYQLAWNLGTNVQYPALNCLPLTLEQQRRATTNVLAGRGPLQDE